MSTTNHPDNATYIYSINQPSHNMMRSGQNLPTIKRRIDRWLRHNHPYLRMFYYHSKYRMVTAPFRSLPDFLVSGARKAGTTTLYDWITAHPEVAPAAKKETDYFTQLHRLGRWWYMSNFPTNRERHVFHLKTGRRLISGETVNLHPFSRVERIKKLLPNARMVSILRNPVDRAYSHYHHNVRAGNEQLSFEEAINAEDERKTNEKQRMATNPTPIPFHHRYHLYLGEGAYADTLSTWFQHFRRDQFLILTTDELAKDPHQVMSKVFEFLGVSPYRLLVIKNLNVGKYDPMDPIIRTRLVEHFKPHNRRLSRLLGRNFDWDR